MIYLQKGGLLIYPLILCSFISTVVIIERLYFWAFQYKNKSNFSSGMLILSTIISICPVLGILGTIMGIIHSFDSIKIEGKQGLNLLSTGISEALITTAYGLFTALISLIFYNYFHYRIEKQRQGL